MTSRRTAIRTCPLCEATCGLRLELEGERVVRVTGDTDDVFSHGYLCAKGAALGALEADPDRLQRPLVRDGGQLHEADWEEAFARLEAGLVPVMETHGADAVAAYVGNPNVHNLAGSLYLSGLLKALGTRNLYTASTVDQMPKHVACGLMYGDPYAIPVPDVDRTDHLLMLGADPHVSNGSLFTAPDLPGRLDALQRRGGRLVVVDPRRSRTAARADEHVAIRPGSDACWLAALAATLFEEDLVALDASAARHQEHVRGLDEVRALVRPFTPEAVAGRCGIDAGTTRRLARELAAAERAVVYGRMGTTTTTFGTLTSWLIDVCTILTGNLDRPGGAMFPRPAHAAPRPGRRPFATGRWRSRVGGHPETLGELPVATLVDEIETPGAGQVRALVVVAGNPVLSSPDSARLDRALAGLSFMVSVDPYLNETARHADVVLPPPGALQRSHYDVYYSGLAVRTVANYSPPVLPPVDGQPDEWQILLRLTAIAAGRGARSDLDADDEAHARALVERSVRNPASRIAGRDADEILAAVGGRLGPERLLDVLLRSGPHGDGFGQADGTLSLAALEAAPHGIDLGPLQPQLPSNLATASGQVELAPPAIAEDVERLRRTLDEPTERFTLVGRRHVRTNNSWMHNVAPLSRGR